MTESELSPKPQRVASGNSKNTVGRLFVLDLSGGRILSLNTDDTSDLKVIVTGCPHPDGIVADVEAAYIYWTDMGVPHLNDGCIERGDLNGQNRTIIIPQGSTYTPKQLYLDNKNGKLYWCDREGMRVMRSNLDSSNIETLVQTGDGDSDRHDATKWCVGITVDAERKQMYWTQKGPDKAGKGRIFRASTEIPNGENAANRTDIEVLFEDLPEPIDLDLHLNRRMLYWTDRGDPSLGNTVNRAPMDVQNPNKRQAPEILLTHLMEGIDIALDLKGQRMFITDLAGSLYSANINGSDKKTLLELEGNLTGVAYAELSSKLT
jgi:hypothetical protein